MADDKAKIKIDVEGQAEAERKLKKIVGSFKDWGREIGGIVAGMVTNLTSVSAQLARVDPGQSAQKFRDYRRTVTEASIASQRSIGELKQSFASLSDRTLLPDEQVADFSGSLAKATYDFGDSKKAIEALRGTGVETGRTLEEMGGIAETLHNQMGVSFNNMPELFGRIEASANAMGMVGGPAALMDDIQALGGMLSQVAINGKRDAGDLVAVLAGIGKGLRPEQQKQVQAALVGRFQAGGEQMRLNLGIKRQDFYDSHGNVRVNAQNVDRLRQFYLKRTGGNVERAQSLAAFSGNLGPQLAAALFRPDLMKNIKEAATAEPGKGGVAALDKLTKSDHGIDTAAQIARDRESRENLGAKTNAAQQITANAMPDSSLARLGVMGVGGGIGQAIVSSIGTGLGPGMATAAKAFFGVAAAGDKAAVVLSGIGSHAVGAGGAAVPVGGVGAAVAAGAGVAGVGLALAQTEAGIREGLYDGMKKVDAERKTKQNAGQDAVWNDLMAGRKKAVGTWWGGTRYEDVPVAEQAKQSAVFRKTVGDRAMPAGVASPVEVHVQITDDSSHPNKVVSVQKGAAGGQ